MAPRKLKHAEHPIILPAGPITTPVETEAVAEALKHPEARIGNPVLVKGLAAPCAVCGTVGTIGSFCPVDGSFV